MATFVDIAMINADEENSAPFPLPCDPQMAGILPTNPSTAPSTTQAPATKPHARHCRFKPIENLIIIREVAASKAHIAPYGQVRTMYEEVEKRCNTNPMMVKVNWKKFQDRYKRPQDWFDKEDSINAKMSGVGGGELGEMNELLSQMREARDDLCKKKDAEKTATKRIEEEKERIGRHLVAASTNRKRKLSPDYDSGNDSAGSHDESAGVSGKRKGKARRKAGMSGELASFGESLKEAELARFELEREHLALERERHSAAVDERERDRDEWREERKEARKERAEERKAQFELEMVKFKEIMGLTRSSRKEV